MACSFKGVWGLMTWDYCYYYFLPIKSKAYYFARFIIFSAISVAYVSISTRCCGLSSCSVVTRADGLGSGSIFVGADFATEDEICFFIVPALAKGFASSYSF